MKSTISPFLVFVLLLIILPLQSQNKKSERNDTNSALHLTRPNYTTPYEIPSKESVKASLDKILLYLESVTPAKVVDGVTGKEIKSKEDYNRNTQIAQGDFRITSYEWGVTYSAMLTASKATGDKRFADYTYSRLGFLSDNFSAFKKLYGNYGLIDTQIRKVLIPRALDDAGAMCAAMLKASHENKGLVMQPMINNYINYIMYGQYRLYDGTFARNRPHINSVWLDDMYMSLPAIVQMGVATGENKYFDETARQISSFEDKMFVKETGLFRHGWVESMENHPSFFWARANGWALLTLTEVLDVFPKNHPRRAYILELYQKHIQALVALQSGEGFWHQLLDKEDSYLETSATAIFTYCIARGINKGWINATTYGAAALLGWNAVSTKINARGQVEGVCVGTGMAFDPAYYYYRPVSEYAAHGYGGTILAGAEIIDLLEKQYPKINDSAIQFYDKNISTTAPIFEIEDNTRPDEIVAGSTRKEESAPVVFLIGDSTVKNGRGKGDGGQWGWGSFFEQFLDSNRISVENFALGGRSSRTFYTEGLWEKVLPGIKKGDYLFIQFGHNDGGPFNTGRARASIKGIGKESEVFIMEKTGGSEEVFTFGHYLRIFIRQAKSCGATVIVLSHTPGNTWDNDKMARNSDTYGKWSKETAQQEGVYFIDLNDLIAKRCETLGKEATDKLYKDRVHTSYEGAMLNCNALVEGIRSIPQLELNKYLKK